MGTERQIDPIAILYSYPSMMTISAAGAWVDKSNGHLMWRPANFSRNAWEQMITGSGNTFGYLTEQQVQNGLLKDRKLLVIPHFMGIALNAATCRAIEQFVADGGIVVADIMPGVCDDHGKLLDKGQLDVLFGVTRGRFGYGQRSSDYLVGVTKQDSKAPVNGTNLGQNGWYIGEWFEQDLRVTAGEALGKHWFTDVPAMIVNHTGKGQSVLLNFLHTSTVRRNGSPEDVDYKLMEQLLTMAGIAPQAHIETSYGAQLRFAEVNTLHDGANSYVGIYANTTADEDPADLIVRFDDTRETYDVRNQTYLGNVDTAPIPLRRKEAALFARLDYRVTDLKFTAASVTAGQPVPVTVMLDTTAKPGRHIVHLRIVDPADAQHPFYTQNVELIDGRWEGPLHTAFNDLPGTWRIDASEVISGQADQTTFVLRRGME